jgi:hypothetical protein
MVDSKGAYRVLVRRPVAKRPLGRSGVDGRIKMDVEEVGRDVWTRLIWLRIGTGGGLLRMR